jgi:polyhydroxyalkanoate synthesis regulator phasin
MKTLAFISFMLLASCAHTETASQQKEFAEASEDRIEAMEKQVTKLSARRDQLLGQPKADLAAAIEALKAQVAKAKDEVNTLENADAKKWLDLKSTVDKELYNMDAAHGTALKVFAE